MNIKAWSFIHDLIVIHKPLFINIYGWSLFFWIPIHVLMSLAHDVSSLFDIIMATMTSNLWLPWHLIIWLPWHLIYDYHDIWFMTTMTSDLWLPWHLIYDYHDIWFMTTMTSDYMTTMTSDLWLPWHLIIWLPWHLIYDYHDIWLYDYHDIWLYDYHDIWFYVFRH